MAAAGKQTRTKGGGAMEKFVTGGEEVKDGGVEKLIKGMEERMGKRMERMGKRMERMEEKVEKTMVDLKEKVRWLVEERKIREEERRKEREEWKRERERLEKRLTELEWMIERAERKNRKKNIIIKGLEGEKIEKKQDLEKFIEDKMKVEVKVKKMSEIRTKAKSNWIIAELESWEQKREVMNKKRMLEKGTYIEDDLTRKERKIQTRLRERAKKEKEDGDKEARVEYKKLCLKGKWYWWNKKEGTLEGERKGGRD